MRIRIIFIIVAIIAVLAVAVFGYIGQIFLGFILSGIMISWPTIFWLISAIMDIRGSSASKNVSDLKQDLIGESSTEENVEAPKGTTETDDEKEFVIPPKKDLVVTKAKEELEKLKKATEFLDDEKKEGILSEDSYNDLKKQNEDLIEKLEQEIAKASGETEEKMVYCRKGKHYISVRDCLPSKIPGYVICQEHNEEIRAE